MLHLFYFFSITFISLCILVYGKETFLYTLIFQSFVVISHMRQVWSIFLSLTKELLLTKFFSPLHNNHAPRLYYSLISLIRLSHKRCFFNDYCEPNKRVGVTRVLWVTIFRPSNKWLEKYTMRWSARGRKSTVWN